MVTVSLPAAVSISPPWERTALTVLLAVPPSTMFTSPRSIMSKVPPSSSRMRAFRPTQPFSTSAVKLSASRLFRVVSAIQALRSARFRFSTEKRTLPCVSAM